MKLNKKEIEMLENYKEELHNKKKYSREEIENLINSISEDAYGSYRSLIDSQLLRAYEIAMTYSHPSLSILDFVHAANEGLEVAVTENDYSDYDSFIKKIEEGINNSIAIILSFFEAN